MISDVTTAAWRAVGSPLLSLTPAPSPRPCARCGEHLAGYAIGTVVSKSFTAFDSWTNPASVTLCRACSWAYRHQLFRAVPHLVTRHPLDQLEALSRTRLLAELATPIDADKAVTIPLRPGRKHIITEARWGHVTTDHGPLHWSSADAACLRTVTALVDLGISPRSLRSPAPDHAGLRPLQPAQVSEVLALWPELNRWRTRQLPWLEVALAALKNRHRAGDRS